MPARSSTARTSSRASSVPPRRSFACSPATTWASWSSTCTQPGPERPNEWKAGREMTDVWGEVAATRTELADLCDSLTPEQWDTQSLCDDWKVRDVVGHLVESTEKLGFGTLFVGMAKNGFSVNKMLAHNGKEWGKKPTDELTKELRTNAGSQIRSEERRVGKECRARWSRSRGHE